MKILELLVTNVFDFIFMLKWNASTGKVHVTTKVKSVYERSTTYLSEYIDGKLINMSLINEVCGGCYVI